MSNYIVSDDIKSEKLFQIGLMRHPPVNVPMGLCYGHLDVELKSGWEDFVILPDNFEVQHIYTSPLSRCFKLAQALAHKYSLPCHIDDRLKEFAFGDWEGAMWDDISPILIDEWANNPWNWQVPGGETGNGLFKRAFMAWLEIKEKEQNALIVSHGGPLRLLRQIAQDQKVELLGELPDFGKVEIFNFSKSK